MTMHNPPHPGEFIKATYLEPFGYSCRFLAQQLDVASSTLSRILKGQSSITPEMALRLSKAVGRTPESWLAMQDNYDLWQAKQTVNLASVNTVSFDAA
ncbi:HigA family addiction module antitoxin [Bacterioplanoides sp.]|uniref:HigA family addiction module antitoxin n=1 Tax=Bacterioplanoides sp. TaxID=2066072 RepID=UPI003AFFED3E